MGQHAAWHAANIRGIVLIDAWKDWDAFNDTVDSLLETNGGPFSAELADELEFCSWHAAWYGANTVYGYSDDAIADRQYTNEHCDAMAHY